jgi:putative endonuclease
MKIGHLAEQLACDYLKNEGLTVIIRNYTTQYGEIDILAMDQHTLVCVEVKYRQRSHYGYGYASVNHAKQLKLQKTLQHYISCYPLYHTAIRFDVISIDGILWQTPTLQWLRQAF